MSYRTSQQKTPLLIFDGNCQAHHLAAIFQGAGLAEAYCAGEDYGFVPAYQAVATTYCTSDEALSYVQQAKAAGRMVYQVSQSTQMQAAAETDYRSLVDAVIKFPFLQYYCIAPHAFERAYGRIPAPERVLSLDLSLMKICQDKAESRTDFVSFVRDRGADTVLFNTESHPRGLLMSMLFRDVARSIASLDEQDVADVAAKVESEEGINHVTVHPVSTDILSSLGFDWGSDYEVKRKLLTACSLGDWPEVIRLSEYAVDLWGDSQLLMALARAYIASGNLEGKGDVFQRIAELSPGFLHSWLLRSQYWRLLNDHDQMRQCRLEMREVLRNNRYYSQSRAWMEIQAGNLQQALNFAFDYLERTPDRADGVVAYVKVLSLMGRADEAKDIFYRFARDRGKADLPNVVAQLPGLLELGIDVEDLRHSVMAAS